MKINGSFFPGRGTLIEETFLEGKEEGRQAGREEGREQGHVVGLLEGQAQSVLRILTTRGITVPEEVRQRVMSCAEPGTLQLWLDRALTASAAEAIFES